MKTRWIPVLGLLAALALVNSCSDDSADTGPNLPPSTVIGPDPAQGSTVPFDVEMAWGGTDSDGRVTSFEIAWRSGPFDSSMFDSLAWESTTLRDTTFIVLADTCYTEGESETWKHTHTIFIRAVDDDGARDPEPPHRSFTATTTPPTTTIINPSVPVQSRCITFRWTGNDQDGETVEYRYVWKADDEYPEDQPPDPDIPGSQWSDWGTHTEIANDFSGEDDPTRSYSFYVQSKDNAGAIETAFKTNENHRIFYVDESRGSRPWIKISVYRGGALDPQKEYITSRSTSNPSAMETPVAVEAGEEFSFAIEFTKGDDATDVTNIQIQEDDPDRRTWSYVSPGQTEEVYPPLGSPFTAPYGITTLYVWVRDNYCFDGSVGEAYIRLSGS